jgi:hypothetical protein
MENETEIDVEEFPHLAKVLALLQLCQLSYSANTSKCKTPLASRFCIQLK